MTEYEQHLHAMQTGVAAEMDIKSEPTEPKHLRVGVNAAMSDHAGLVRLLIEKGVISEGEYIAAITAEMEREKQRYEYRLSAYYGRPIHLGGSL